MNEQFLERMKAILSKEDYDAFCKEIEGTPRRGFRINLLKTDETSFFDVMKLQKEKTPFASNGYYLLDDISVGSSPAYEAGVFYMQEPSASSVVPLMGIHKDIKVLDMCAAPGSKTTEIIERMENTGFLVSNEIHPKRVKILKENVIRYGACNTLVLNNDPSDIAKAFGSYFDMVLVDAPCSGEGMFRKNEEAVTQWSYDNVLLCAKRQRRILECAYQCLKPGGILMYSTCTFAPEENEENMVWFLNEHNDMKIVPVDASFGRPGLDYGSNTKDARRIFPMDQGEGHFICKLQKAEDDSFEEHELSLLKSDPMPSFVMDFINENLEQGFAYYFVHGNRVYGGNQPFINPKGCHIINHQVYLGEIKNKRFEPSHDLAMNAYVKFKKNFEVDDEQAVRFMKGESLPCENEKGYYRVNWNGYALGYGKCDGKTLKNHFPKEFRRHH